MMNRYKTLLYYLVSIAFLIIPTDSIAVIYQPNDVDEYQSGLAELHSGNIDKALQIWGDAAENGEPDYRIGYFYIKTVTGNEKRGHYQKASEIYYRGLQSENVTDDDAELLKRDLEFIRPLLGMREGNRFERMIDARDSQIYGKIEAFWNAMKLSITGNYNERLLEHWERVSYSLENFATTSREVYDDRGRKYIKYGAPERIRSGVLIHDPGFASSILSMRMDDTVDGLGDNSGSTIFMNTLYQVRELHNNAEFEIWVYYNLSDHFNNVPFIFGSDDGGNVMRKKNSVDDFIPNSAFNAGGRNEFFSHGMSAVAEGAGSGDTDAAFEASGGVTQQQDNIPPAVVLQMMYYRQLATIDSYFSSRYDDMLNRYESTATRLSSSIAREFQQFNISFLQRTQRYAPAEKSTYINGLHYIESNLYAYRFLDEQLNPYLRVFLETESEEAVTIEELKNHNNINQIDFTKYVIINQLQLISENSEIDTTTFNTLPINNENIALDSPISFNAIQVQHNNELTELISKFELHTDKDIINGRISDQSTFLETLKGYGSSKVELEPALVGDNFTTSDVILGYSNTDGDGEDHFTIAHHSEIPANRNLNFYYEAYNLPRNEEGFYSFSLNYAVEKSRSWLGRAIRFGRSSGPSITIENTTDSPTFSQLLEIVADDLREGEYKLNLTFKDADEEIFHKHEVYFSIQ